MTKRKPNTKRKAVDAMSASVKNIREQRFLERQLDEIEKLWYQQLKNMTRDRLEAMFELTKLEYDKKNAHYFDQNIEGSVLKNFSEKTRIDLIKTKDDGKSMDKFGFKTNEWLLKSVRLPEVEKPIEIMKENGIQQSIPMLDKPKLYRSNSVSLHKASSEDNVFVPAETMIVRKPSRESPFLSLPNINKLDLTMRTRRSESENRVGTLDAIPDILEEPPEPPQTAQSRSRAGVKKGRRLPSLQLRLTSRGHTVL